MTRPRVVIQAVASLDGKITLAPGVLLLHGDERWQTVAGEADELGAWLRATHRPQAILEGSGSFVAANVDPGAAETGTPSSRDRAEDILYTDYLPPEIVDRPGHRGWFTVVDGRGRIRWGYKEWPDEAWRGWYLLVLVCRQTPPEYLAYLRSETIPYLVAGAGPRVDLGVALDGLARELGVTCLLSTAGGTLNGALLRAGLVDELNVELLPALFGGRETPSFYEAPALAPGERPVRLQLVSATSRESGRVWLRYSVLSQLDTPRL